MSDITESDLLAVVRAEYLDQLRQPGDVTIQDILNVMLEINPEATEPQAEYRFKLLARNKEYRIVKILEFGKNCKALRKKTPQV